MRAAYLFRLILSFPITCTVYVMPAVHCVVFVDKILTLPLSMLSSVIVLVLRTGVQLSGRHIFHSSDLRLSW